MSGSPVCWQFVFANWKVINMFDCKQMSPKNILARWVWIHFRIWPFSVGVVWDTPSVHGLVCFHCEWTSFFENKKLSCLDVLLFFILSFNLTITILTLVWFKVNNLVTWQTGFKSTVCVCRMLWCHVSSGPVFGPEAGHSLVYSWPCSICMAAPDWLGRHDSAGRDDEVSYPYSYRVSCIGLSWSRPRRPQWQVYVCVCLLRCICWVWPLCEEQNAAEVFPRCSDCRLQLGSGLRVIAGILCIIMSSP